MPIHISHAPLAGEIAAIVIGVLVVAVFAAVVLRSRIRRPARPIRDGADHVEREAPPPFGRPHF